MAVAAWGPLRLMIKVIGQASQHRTLILLAPLSLSWELARAYHCEELYDRAGTLPREAGKYVMRQEHGAVEVSRPVRFGGPIVDYPHELIGREGRHHALSAT
jgi:hypothetical protein